MSSKIDVDVNSGAAKEAIVDTSKQRKQRGMPKGSKEAVAADMEIDAAQPSSAILSALQPIVAPHEMVGHATVTLPCCHTAHSKLIFTGGRPTFTHAWKDLCALHTAVQTHREWLCGCQVLCCMLCLQKLI